MSSSSSRNPFRELRTSDIRGIARLAAQSTAGVTRIAEGVHLSVWKTMGIPGGKAPGTTRGITGLVYKSVHDIALLLGQGVDTTLTRLQPLLESVESAEPATPGREAFLSALNGVIGDHLVASDSSFAIPMSLRYRGKEVNWQAQPSMPEATGKVLLLVHGLCMSDLQWQTHQEDQSLDHGQELAGALGYTPVYLRYNSGLHTSQNGRELSAALEQMVAHWPVPIEELAIVAHSMGGLLARSAFHYATQDSLGWPAQLKRIVFLGTPHHGALLEQAGNWVDTILSSIPYTAPFATLGRLRSAGITDLRHGHLLDEDWQGHDRFHPKSDDRRIVPLPAGVDCYAVAATMAGEESRLANRLIGDGLVPLPSALGRHSDERRQLDFAPASQRIAYGMNHMALLRSPEISRQIVQWLAPA